MTFPRPPAVRAALVAILACAGGRTVASLAAEAPDDPGPYLCPEELLHLDAPPPVRRSPVSSTLPIEVSSDSIDLTLEGARRLSGNVELSQGDRHLSADAVQVDAEGRAIRVEGNVKYRDPELRVSGRSGEYNAGVAQIEEAQFELPLQPARGSARSLNLDVQGKISLKGVNYTTCPRDVRGWRISADDVSLDTKRQIGVARGAKVEFLGVPIFYLPWITFPAGPARKSGFLFPTVGSSSRGGLQFSTPYYFNLAPNYDFTATPTYYMRRGLDLHGEGRYLSSNSRLTLEGNFLPDDHAFGTDRSRVKLTDRTALPAGWLLRISAENVSDVSYYEDFTQGADSTSVAFLPRTLQLSYRDATWNAGALVRNFQTIDPGLAAIDRPYTELPRLYASGWWRTGAGLPLEVGFDAETTGFDRNIGVTGWRLDVQPQAALRFEGPGWFVTPAAAFRSTSYALDGVTPGQTTSPSRNLPLLSLDTGMIFERAAGTNGKRRMTLEPRLMYLYAPYRNQDDIPVFDTGVPDLNWVQLFRDNRYVGADRVGDANQLTAGLTTRLFASDSGTRFLSATVGQTVYFETPRVALPTENLAGRDGSDYIAQLELRAFRNWNVDMGVQWNPQAEYAERSEIRVQYRPESTRVVNLGYRYQRDRLEQADVSAAWPVAKDWRLYGRVLYSLRDDNAIEQFAGLEYGSCCWGVRAVARRYVSNRTGERDSGFLIQLELKGLSSVGTAADAFLERAIRGYSARP
ncbi:MAG: LPS assembly protein LptD [Steroidobacteraceae bacterium]